MATETSIRFKVETRDANRKVAALERQVNKLEVAVRKSGGSTGVASNAIKAFGKGAGAAGVSTKALGTAVAGILGPLSAAAAVAGSVVAGFKGFVEADKARAAVSTLGVDAKALENQLVGVVARTDGLASSNELLAASYDVASAGFSNAADITKILEASVLGATGGMTDIATVSDAATSVMNSYGLTTDSVAKIVDGFIQTQNDGKIVVGQYASQIGRVAPIAAAAGVGLDELNAAISTVTAQGVPVESTFAGINQVIASVVKPTAEAAKASKRLGLDFSSAAIKTKGFGGFLEDVIKATGGSEVEITKLFGSVDALKALMPLINDDLVTFNENLGNQKDATGAAKDAADIMGQTVSSQITKIVNKIGTLMRSLDQVLGPAIKGILDLVNTVITAAVRATDALGKMFRMNAARTQARKELGGVMGRGTRKADEAEVEALALKNYEANEKLRKAVTQPPTVELPAPQTIPTGGITGGTTSGKTEEEKLLETREKQLKAAKALLVTKQQEAQLIKATTQKERDLLQLGFDKLDLSKQFPNLEADELQALRDQLDINFGLTQTDKERIQAAKDLAQQQDAETARVEKLAQQYQGIADTLANGVVNALKGAVDGTTSLADAATSLLNDLGNQMLQLARNMLFFGNIAGSLVPGGGILGSIFGGFMAKGGTVTGGRSYVVGEQGPELFTPGRSGSIAPSGSFGDTNVVVNVDASGSQAQGNQSNAKALGAAIGAAVQAELVKQKRPGGLLS